MGIGVLLGLGVLLAGVLMVVGFIAHSPIAIGLGFLLIALCAIYGTQPGWPRRQSS